MCSRIARGTRPYFLIKVSTLSRVEGAIAKTISPNSISPSPTARHRYPFTLDIQISLPGNSAGRIAFLDQFAHLPRPSRTGGLGPELCGHAVTILSHCYAIGMERIVRPTAAPARPTDTKVISSNMVVSAAAAPQILLPIMLRIANVATT